MPEPKSVPDQKPEQQKEIPESDWPEWLKGTGGFVLETVKIVLISLAIILPIRYFLVQPFYVRGASMEPTFHDFEYLLIDEISYRISDPARGDIVVFHYPQDPSQYFIKRIIGLPGETVTIKDGQVDITPATPEADVILNESGYLDDSVVTSCSAQQDCITPVTLGEDEYFVMGDNRTASLDSRYFGPLTRDHIVGKAWVRVWPFTSFTLFEDQTYNL